MRRATQARRRIVDGVRPPSEIGDDDTGFPRPTIMHSQYTNDTKTSYHTQHSRFVCMGSVNDNADLEPASAVRGPRIVTLFS